MDYIFPRIIFTQTDLNVHCMAWVKWNNTTEDNGSKYKPIVSHLHAYQSYRQFSTNKTKNVLCVCVLTRRLLQIHSHTIIHSLHFCTAEPINIYLRFTHTLLLTPLQHGRRWLYLQSYRTCQAVSKWRPKSVCASSSSSVVLINKCDMLC